MRIDVGDESDVLGDGELGQDAVDVLGQDAGIGVPNEKLEPVKVVSAGDGVGIGHPNLHALGWVFADAAMDGLEGELGPLLVPTAS